MGPTAHKSTEDAAEHAGNSTPPIRRRSRWRVVGLILLFLIGLLVAVRIALPSIVIWYVNRTIDQSPMYDGKIGDVDIFLWRGAYTIKDIRLDKTTGSVPVPLFSAPRMDLAIEWNALFNGKIVGRIVIDQPKLNFVDSEEDSEDQTGGGGPWLKIIDELFPFQINSCEIRDGSIHFIAFNADPPVDVYLSNANITISNLTNVHDDVAPMIATVTADALAMDHARLDLQVKFDPASYRPTFDLAFKLIGLDVTKINQLARAYGSFDFEEGWFDLIIELDAREGYLEGSIKPLFRNLKVLSLREDIQEDDVLRVFWESLVGVTTGLLTNPPRDQFGTLINVSGDLTSPNLNLLEILGNVLRNAFIRAYLPRFSRQVGDEAMNLQFAPGSVVEPGAPGAP